MRFIDCDRQLKPNFAVLGLGLQVRGPGLKTVLHINGGRVQRLWRKWTCRREACTKWTPGRGEYIQHKSGPGHWVSDPQHHPFWEADAVGGGVGGLGHAHARFRTLRCWLVSSARTPHCLSPHVAACLDFRIAPRKENRNVCDEGTSLRRTSLLSLRLNALAVTFPGLMGLRADPCGMPEKYA